ncbi:MAG TPA: UDP-N-acetylmuramoyl-L-alanyl-D-glutamate--2,6-diaminopimelate ligase [Myxococcota bacterium]|nr:UDP-N-acetylmuramoyl-L-alanyl-D-glutamate--2,6-diaminopimelate ligase [Myxococcota bacterium]
MRFSELLSALPPALAPLERPALDPVIRGVQYDSRAVAPGDLFVALRGASADGHGFVPHALALGAVAPLCERAPASTGGAAVALVRDTRRALAPIANAFFGAPSRELALIGITGTNGKTSTTFLTEAILRAAGERTGLIGTVEVRYADERLRSVNTTPESLDLQRLLRDMRTRGVSAVSMEVSSHGLELGRVDGCEFRAAAITNVTQDHLDFHGTMDAYQAAKERLFHTYLAADGVAVINVDEPRHAGFVAAAEKRGARRVLVSKRRDAEADVRVTAADVSLAGTRARLAVPSGELALELPLVGDFNLENLTLAVGVAVGLGIAPDAIVRGVAACPQVPGRMQRVGAELPGTPTVLVDYAHTPDAVEKVLRAVRPLTKGKLIAVFGCGGDRDRTKRPRMAEAVARLADRAVLTSDNPRTEDPLRILADVEAGLGAMARVSAGELASAEHAYVASVDRREAIELAIASAQPADTIVIAGKGHEDYQIIGREKLPFDDREEAQRALARRAR